MFGGMSDCITPILIRGSLGILEKVLFILNLGLVPELEGEGVFCAFGGVGTWPNRKLLSSPPS